LWRAADDPATTGFGGICLVAVIWLGFYGTRAQVWAGVAGSVLALLAPPLFIGEAIVGDDWRRALLSGAVCALVGPTINSLVRRGEQSDQRVSALEPAGSRLDAVLRAATGHIIVACDPDGTIVEFNQGAERLLGYRADEVIGKHTPLLFHDPAETLARARDLGVEPGLQVFNQAAKRGEVEIRDWTYLTKDGRRIIVSLSITAVRDAQGAITGYVEIGTDVTASRATMQTLASQREIYRLLVEHLPMTTVGLFDTDLKCLTIGGHWLRKVGAEPASLRGKRIDEFFAPPDREHALAMYERARGGPVTEEWLLSDGRLYEFSAVPVDGPDGKPLVLSLARDVTDKQQAVLEKERVNSALAMSEASFREAFDGAPIGIALLSVGPDERFLRVNAAFAAILGRRPDELVGIAVAEVTHPEDAGLQPDLSDGANPRTMRKRFVRPSGRTVWVEVNYAVVRDAAGNPSHVIKQIQDIHTIKESERALLDALEQQRAATARLRELDRIRTDLVGTVSHELRTPLTSIHGYLELLGDEDLTQVQHGMLEVAVRNTERLAGLVDNLLVLVRLDSVDADVAGTDDVQISAALSAAIDTVRPEFVDRNQQLDVNLPVDRAIVRGDFDQIDRVLVNLLSNASKYTPSGGRVGVDVAVIGSRTRIRVTDTGIGIPPDELPHLFTRFFRASTARANSISGNGLGLAIVKSIVERHGGSVSVESTLGSGTTFTVVLPIAPDAELPRTVPADVVGQRL
jgi:PAS domain S-box-containing protein